VIGRARSERGFVLPTAIMILFIVMLVTATLTKLAVTSLSEDRRDRSSAEAFQLADSAINTVTYHMNRHLVSDEVRSLLGFTTGVVATDACLTLTGNVYALEMTTDVDARFCPEISLPGLEEGEEVTCFVGVEPNLSLVPLSLLERPIVCQGDVGGAKRRILANMTLSISAGKPTKLWRRAEWVECTGEFQAGQLPTVGCPT
jgi:hypothetical protein